MGKIILGSLLALSLTVNVTNFLYYKGLDDGRQAAHLESLDDASSLFYFRGKRITQREALKIALYDPNAVFSKVTGSKIKYSWKTMRFKRQVELNRSGIKTLLK